MAKKTGELGDEQRLKKKIETRREGSEASGTAPALRNLRKRLKRIQRKRRRLALRKLHAQKHEAGTEAKAAG